MIDTVDKPKNHYALWGAFFGGLIACCLLFLTAFLCVNDADWFFYACLAVIIIAAYCLGEVLKEEATA